PPREAAKVPDHPTVMEAAFTSAVAELPPRVKVTFVSLVLVNAASAELPVPPLLTPNIPLISAVKDIAANVGEPDAFPCKTVVVVPGSAVTAPVVLENNTPCV